MSKCPIGLVECKYPRNCFKTCNVCIRTQKQDELESMLLEAEIKSYNQALEDAEKRYREWSKSEYGKVASDDVLPIRVLRSLKK